MDIATSFYLSALLIFILLKTGIGFKDENLLSTTYSKISEQWIIKMKATQNSTKEHSSFKKLLLLYDYIEADNLTVIHNYGPLKVRKLRFVHIPKTGTTFAATVVHYCCGPALDKVYINVLLPFSSIIPGDSYRKMFCGHCLESQARSYNGDPWAHIPFRIGIDSYISIAIFRNPITRLASQLIYADYIGVYMSESFGFRRVDSMILIGILRNKSISTIQRHLKLLTQMNSDTRNNGRNKLSDYAFRYHELNKLDYTNSSFHHKILECINLTKSYYDNINNNNNIINNQNNNESYNFLIQNEKYMICKLEAILLYPGLLGCQTKMVLGRNCFDIYEVTSEDLIEAKRRISEEFLFIGIHEKWEESVISFHKLYGGKLFSDEFINHRASKNLVANRVHQLINIMMLKKKKSIISDSVQYQQYDDYIDPWDTELYKHALNVFHSKL